MKKAKNTPTNSENSRALKTTRRQFLKTAAAAPVFMIVPRYVLGGPKFVSPNEKTTIGCIGLGGQGHIDLFNLLQYDEVQVAAVCDVDKERGGYISWDWMKGTDTRLGGREPARGKVNAHYAEKTGNTSYASCAAYADFREMLDKEDLDAVVVAVPDHSHATVTMAALKIGKHVYCEKPLTYSVYEAREIAKAAKVAGVATQLGNQGQATEEARVIQEYILDGALGDVREVHLQLGTRFWDAPKRGTRPPETPPVPEGLDWNLWLGPAPERPYHPAYHPWSWRDWRDFGTSSLGDLGCHKLSVVFKALKLKYPIRIEGECEDTGPEVYPRNYMVKYVFPAREGFPELTLTWNDGVYKAPHPEGLEAGRSVSGTIFVGDKATLMGSRIVPESKMQAYGRPPRVLPRSPGQYKEWLDACRGGEHAGSDFVDHGAILTETPILGNIALKAGRKLEWDGDNMRFTNDDGANKLLRREYRDGWTL